MNLTKASDFTLDIELFPPLWGGGEEGVCVGEVFTHLWDKYASQGHEEHVLTLTVKFHHLTALMGSLTNGQIWDSLKEEE